MDDWLSARERVRFEWSFRWEAGYAVERPDPDFDASEDVLAARLAELRAAPMRTDWPFVEPSELTAVLAELGPARPIRDPQPAELRSRLAGAWTARIAGNMLGKPVEVGWTRDRLAEYLRLSGSLDDDGVLRRWVVADEELAREHRLEPSWRATTRGRIDGSVRDDDIDHTILALLVLEQRGGQLTGGDIADAWLHRLPYLEVFTAEREAYAALVRGDRPPRTATADNPFGEWIGALIRADAYGLVNPGRPRRAAELALHDASVSHVKNGLYAAMWAASLVANALTLDDPVTVVAASLAEVPLRCRLRDGVERCLELHAGGTSWDAALARLDADLGLDRLHHVHVLNNAAVIAAAILWGDGDPATTVGLAVQGGLDTDSNAATAGAVVGALVGEEALPSDWAAVLGGTVRTSLAGVGDVNLADLVARTALLVDRLADA